MSPVTLRVVRHISRIRSTPSMSAIKDGFTPIVVSTTMMKGIEPDGTPAVPMPPSMARYATRNCFPSRSEEHTSELQSQSNLVCRLLLEKKKKTYLYSTRLTRVGARGFPSTQVFCNIEISGGCSRSPTTSALFYHVTGYGSSLAYSTLC